MLDPEWLDLFVSDAETPTRDVLPRKNAPAAAKVLAYWAPLLEEAGLSVDAEYCWACGANVGYLERAHILARIEGGSNEPSNLHLLCPSCHLDSEMLHGRDYWQWFCWPQKQMIAKAKRIASRQPLMAVVQDKAGDEGARLTRAIAALDLHDTAGLVELLAMPM
ncbi:HNH endonuclease signature motif containing protein [Agromyces larvae]|uniref:HNH endonuclease n=1 Tax=Agromyces larvae TaxID=2929802 RepID=A0ABY4CB07_9MICO|nr:HNH endonuclease signature motif containing protein [Agromyces larvae]UOE45880.1 HNH endonuclease [Agromyces larvae]